MNAVDDWQEFAGVLDTGQLSNGLGSDWLLIFSRRTRTVALPAATFPDGNSLRFFVLTARKRIWARLALICHRLIPELLPQTRLSDGQHRQLQRLLGDVDDVSCTASSRIMAIQFGSRGPLQKVTVLATSPEGTPLVGKFALRASADERIAIEANCLEHLARVPALAMSVPSLIRTGTTGSGRRFFVMSAVSGMPTDNTFSQSHAEFLRGLSVVDADTIAWESSNLVREIEPRFATIAPGQTSDMAVLRAGWNTACGALAGRAIPVCLNHGDFASWNLLQSTRGLIAMDWEYARSHWNPLGDYFHFHLIPAALDGRLRQDHVSHEQLMASAVRHMVLTFGVDEALAKMIVLPLLMVYMIDTVSFYAVSSGGIERTHPVVDSYLQYLGAHS